VSSLRYPEASGSCMQRNTSRSKRNCSAIRESTIESVPIAFRKRKSKLLKKESGGRAREKNNCHAPFRAIFAKRYRTLSVAMGSKSRSPQDGNTRSMSLISWEAQKYCTISYIVKYSRASRCPGLANDADPSLFSQGISCVDTNDDSERLQTQNLGWTEEDLATAMDEPDNPIVRESAGTLFFYGPCDVS
jgi:hypothetical protein